MSRWHNLLLLSLALALPAGAAAQQQPCAMPSSTFELIQTAIFERHGCNVSYCHGDARVAGLDLRAGEAYASLLPRNVRSPSGEHFDFVKPRRPEESSLWLTLAKKTLQLTDVPGAPMPIGGAPLSPDQLEGVRLWIALGAPEKGVVAGVSNLIEACLPPPDYEGEELPPACDPNDTSILFPDLVTEPPWNVRVIYKDNHRLLGFSTAIANVGDGPLIVQAQERPMERGQSLNAVQILLRADGTKCSRQAGALMYESGGKHWAYGDTVGFELRKDDPLTGVVLARRTKEYYCLMDTDPMRASEDRPHQFDAHCEDNIGRMGISVGYKDVYHRVHPGQWIDLDADPETDIEPGRYYLVNLADPANTFFELDGSPESNSNYTRVSVNLPKLASADEPTPVPRATRARPTRRPRPQVGVHPPRPPRPPRATRVPRPTRPPRPPRVREKPTPRPRPQVGQRPQRRPRPTRRPRATRPPRPTRPPHPPRPGRVATVPIAPTPTPRIEAPVSGPARPSGCDHACPYGLSQLRMTWYDHTGLNLNFQVSSGGCSAIVPTPGEAVEIQMTNWITEPGDVTSRLHEAQLVLGDDASTAQMGGRSVTLEEVGGRLRFTYESDEPALARADDGMNFPVAFDLCVMVGNQSISARLVCQPKNTGMLCHL